MSGVSLCHLYFVKYEKIQASLKSHPKISQLHDRPNINFYLPSLILNWRLISEKKKKSKVLTVWEKRATKIQLSCKWEIVLLTVIQPRSNFVLENICIFLDTTKILVRIFPSQWYSLLCIHLKMQKYILLVTKVQICKVGLK